MQWSSKSIARLAAALAKAQAELKNPEKTLTATIYPERRNGERGGKNDAAADGGRTFNYASLASGLEIVRTTLSQHGIAVVQTTAIEAQLVKLSTVLAHSSGEWIASDWPVCAVRDTETPHRMGAALTYARRYALFSMVGIVGEDDLDAPDLVAPGGRGSAPERTEASGNGKLTSDGGSSPRSGGNGKAKTSPRPVLEPGTSSELRDRLAAQIAEIRSADEAALWAYCNMRAKNGLTAADALKVEEAFQTKLAGFPSPQEAPSSKAGDAPPKAGHKLAKGTGDVARPDPSAAAGAPAAIPDAKPPSPPVRSRSRARRRTQPTSGIDKTLLAFPEPRRIRDREHVRFVASKPCLVCGRTPSDPHHLRFTQSRALGRKVSDEFTVPLCRGHHREVHRGGDEAAWWQNAGIDPTVAARAFWLETHPLLGGGTENGARWPRSSIGTEAN